MEYKKTKKSVIIIILSLLSVPIIYAQSKYKLTPNNMEGPFYPIERQSDEDNDLINVNGKPQSAKGDVLNLTGVVFNQKGNSQSDIIIEIWQTDANGIYRHPRDKSVGTRDPFF